MDIAGIKTELSTDEKKWWRKAISSLRKKVIKDPLFYVTQAVEKQNLNLNDIENDYNNSIKMLRSIAWDFYTADELSFHNEVLIYLVNNREYPARLIKELTDSTFPDLSEFVNNREKFIQTLSSFVGEYTGKIMPYIYELSLSTTNSRRSRSGKTFEAIIKKIFLMKSIPFEDQSSLGEGFFKDNNVGKIVDFVVPSKEKYLDDRAQTMVITMKTSLRERWQEVVEELRRTNIPSIYLLTVDPNLTQSGLTVMKQHNIKVVLYDEVKRTKFNSFSNVIGYSQFFKQEVPHYLNYWGTIKNG